uniref:Uncharacterized protein n=1 Tax=Arundo donax TaxID=35708 RepID=A0A0A9FQP1_ARUDO
MFVALRASFTSLFYNLATWQLLMLIISTTAGTELSQVHTTEVLWVPC